MFFIFLSNSFLLPLADYLKRFSHFGKSSNMQIVLLYLSTNLFCFLILILPLHITDNYMSKLLIILCLSYMSRNMLPFQVHILQH